MCQDIAGLHPSAGLSGVLLGDEHLEDHSSRVHREYVQKEVGYNWKMGVC